MDAGKLPPHAAQDPKAWDKAQTFAQTLVHLTSLLHAVALQHLRSDWELSNLTPYRIEDPPPPLVQLSSPEIALDLLTVEAHLNWCFSVCSSFCSDNQYLSEDDPRSHNLLHRAGCH